MIRVIHTGYDREFNIMHSATKPYAVVLMHDSMPVVRRVITRCKTFSGAAKRAAAERIYRNSNATTIR